jgi:hypothetical protein
LTGPFSKITQVDIPTTTANEAKNFETQKENGTENK